MTDSIRTAARDKCGPPDLLSPVSRAIAAAAVVFATATSVWWADAVSSSLPPAMARTSTPTGTRVANALPTVTIVGRRESLGDVPAWAGPAGDHEVSSLALDDQPTGRVKLRQ